MTTIPTIKMLLEAENKYAANSYNGMVHSKITEHWNGKMPGSLVAVHAVNHFRDHLYTPKVADVLTGSLVSTISQLTSATAIINSRTSPEINPHTGVTPATKLLQSMSADASKFILDIHGAKNNPNFDIAFGTHHQILNDSQKKMINILIQVSEAFDLKWALNPEGYAARGRHTITAQTLALGISSSIQVEIIRKFRDPNGQPENILLMVNFLIKCIGILRNEL